jgi:hypothetical protein
MGAILPGLVSQLGKSGTVKAGEEHPLSLIVEPVKIHEASVHRDVHSSRIETSEHQHLRSRSNRSRTGDLTGPA